MRALVEVDLDAIGRNIQRIKRGSQAQILAVVKANAYGHGLVPVAEAALQAGATWLGVALLEEALELRKSGITAPIISWLTPPGEDFETALLNNIDLAVPSLEIFHEILGAAERTGIRPRIHIEIDSGMSRGGFLTQWDEFLSHLVNRIELVQVVGVWTHFARADEPNSSATAEQIENFSLKVLQLNEQGIHPEFIHMANSAAALTNSATHADVIRIGIAMYGLSPDRSTLGSSKELDLEPAMTLKGKIHSVKWVPAGSAVGYGGTAILDNDSFLAIIALGYSDGIPRNTSSDAEVCVGGKFAPIVGRVSMDQFVVNLGPTTQVKPGDMAIIFGKGGSSVDQWAAAAGTINYEIVTRIASRVPRIYQAGADT